MKVKSFESAQERGLAKSPKVPKVIWDRPSSGRTHGGNPSVSGESAPGGTSAQKFETSEARSIEEPKGSRNRRRNLDHQIQNGHVAKDHELWVKSLWENMKDEGLKSSKPEQPKQLGVVDPWEDMCHWIIDSG
jgi:hypothetical protein